MKKLLATTMLIGAMSAMSMPAFAMEDGMSCADYTKMDSAGQMKAMESMKMEADNMKSDDSSSDDSMKSDDKMAMGDMSAKDVAAACKGHDDMMVHDAMMGGDKMEK